MTRKRFIKKKMGLGISRNRARHEARCIEIINKHAEKVNKNATKRELEAVVRYIIGESKVKPEPIQRKRMLSYQEAWDRVSFII